MAIVAANTIDLVSSLITGLFWAFVLRGPYWLFKRFRGEPIAFWWPWGVFIAGLTGGSLLLAYLVGYGD